MAGFKDAVDTFSKILWPIVVAGIGVFFNIVQFESNKQQLAADRVTSLLQHLASDNTNERKLAVTVIRDLAEREQVPPELGAALVAILSDTNESVKRLASGAFTKVSQRDTTLRTTLKRTVQSDTAFALALRKTDFSDVNATITSPDTDFLTCKDVVNLEPVGIASSFEPGSVSLWARVRTPQTSEALRLEWVDSSSKEVLHEQSVTVKRNPAGYRIHYSKNFTEPGQYEVRLFNSIEQRIARRKFTVGQLTQK